MALAEVRYRYPSAPVKKFPLGFVTCLLLLSSASGIGTASASASEPDFLIEVAGAGVYRLGYERLVGAGLDVSEVTTDSLRMNFAGEPLPLRVVDGGDGRFGSGDHLEFVAPRLGSMSRNYSRIHRLALSVHGAEDPASPIFFAEMQTSQAKSNGRWRREYVIEEDLVRAIFPRGNYESYESWYWRTLSCLDVAPFKIVLPDSARLEGAHLVLEVRGATWLTHNLDEMRDHALEIYLDGQLMGTDQWDGTFEHEIELTLPSQSQSQSQSQLAQVDARDHILTLKLKKRRTKSGMMVADVVHLNRVRMEADDEDQVLSDGGRFTYGLQDGAMSVAATMEIPASTSVYLAGPEPGFVASAGQVRNCALPVFPNCGAWLVPEGGLLTVHKVTKRPLSGLGSPENQADYLMIACPRFVDKTRRLADFHRARGLRTRVINVADIYSEFSGGLAHPDSIRRFLQFVHRSWSKPSARFVLLVGDASYEPVAVQQESTTFIPTFYTPIGTALIAADNGYACIDNNDFAPDVALGRLPVRTTEELEVVIDKTIACAAALTDGEREDRMLWISGPEDEFRHLVSQVTEWSTKETSIGAHHHIASPRNEDSPDSNVETKLRILEQFRSGYKLSAFVGHGSRNWWRVGTPDLAKGTDLFSRA